MSLRFAVVAQAGGLAVLGQELPNLAIALEGPTTLAASLLAPLHGAGAEETGIVGTTGGAAAHQGDGRLRIALPTSASFLLE